MGYCYMHFAFVFTLTSSIDKLLGIIIMRKFGTVLSACDLQCGFKENGLLICAPLW